jgi:hypothetical protein
MDAAARSPHRVDSVRCANCFSHHSPSAIRLRKCGRLTSFSSSFSQDRLCPSACLRTYRDPTQTNHITVSMHQHRMDGPSGHAGSGLRVASSVASRAGEKRRLENREVSEPTPPIHSSVQSSPQRQCKIARRDGNTDITRVKEMGVKTVAPIREIANENRGDGDINGEEMNLYPASTTALLVRMGDVPVADHFTSISYATSSAAGVAGAVDSSLMARIYTQGKSATSTSYSQPARTSHPPPAKAPQENGIAASSSVLAIPVPKMMPELAQHHVQTVNTVDVSMRDVEQTRTKCVIGRSENQTTVNGVAISTGKNHGENRCTSCL